MDEIVYNTTNLITASQKVATDTSWFDGSSGSIYDRLEKVQSMLDNLRVAASNPHATDGEISKIADQVAVLESDKELLQKTAAEYVDFDTEEYLQNLPGGTVASTYYKVNESGTFDLGEDDGSFLYSAAKEVQDEVNSVDWGNFVTAGAESWTFEQSPELTSSQLATREAACSFVERKTASLLDTTFRASVIDNFLDNVEICRREKVANIVDAKKKSSLRTAKNEYAQSYVFDQAIGDKYNWL
jgi:hypothetical protein